MDNLTVNELAVVNGNVSVFGNTAMNGDASVTGLLEADDLVVNLTTRMSGNVGMGGAPSATAGTDLKVYGNVEILGAINGGGIGAPTGSILAFGGTAAPTGYLLCDGAAVNRTTYAALFAIIAVAYGAGDGSTTFNVPNLQQRFPLGKASAGTGSTLGTTGGAIDHTHTFSQNAPVSGTGSGTTTASTTGNNGTTGTTQLGSNQTISAQPHTHSIPSLTVSVTSLSGTAAVNSSTGAANPPYQVVNYIIKT